MSPRITVATSARVLHQLRADPRTVALLLLVPTLLLTLFRFIFDGDPALFDRIGVPLVGVFPLISMFLVTSVATVRERTSGTLERLMTLPLAKLDLLLGYGLAFAAVATVQAVLVTSVGIGLLGLDVGGSVALVLVFAVANAILGTTLGLLVSAFAAGEFQAVQFLPAFLLPQILLCGLIVPRDRMARALELASDVLPMTYAYDGLSRLALADDDAGRIALDLAVLLVASLLALTLGAATLRRRTA